MYTEANPELTVFDLECVEVDQDAHPDGAVFGLVNPQDSRRSLRTVLCVEPGKTREERMARAMHNGLRHVLQSRVSMHPHVWPGCRGVVIP